MRDVTGEVEAELARAIGRSLRIERREPLPGGDISRVVRLHTTAGTFVLKSHPSPPPRFFVAEAEGLSALRRSASLRIPDVVAVRDDTPAFLVLEDLGEGAGSSGFDEAFGRGLARLHRHVDARFGFERDNFCGATPQRNTWSDTWIRFYGEHRLGYQIEIASRRGLLSTADRARLERLIDRLDGLIDEPVAPSLIHGDLWSGNLHACADGSPALIDPAVSFAHREAELGMMTLFGGFPSRVFAAYDEALPLEAGWRERQPFYQLYHLLNHLNLFGRGYHGQVMSVAGRYV